jgi:DNA polymerase I-like protein with 3'-5' exonuclease and polymerase domains
VKGDYGLRIREAFVAPEGHKLLCADYSQIEPRILAHLSQDPRLLAVFSNSEDIHMATAMEIFSLPADQITKDMRRAAKTVVFGIVYGISPFGLSQNIGVPQSEAKNTSRRSLNGFRRCGRSWIAISPKEELRDYDDDPGPPPSIPNCKAEIRSSAVSASAWP